MGAGSEPLVDLAPRGRQHLPRPGSRALATARSQPHRVSERARPGLRREPRPGARPPQPHQLRASAHARVSARTPPGAIRTPGSCWRARWRTSRPSSACTNPCRSTRAGLGVLAGDHIKSASDLGVPLVRSGCSTTRATSASGSIRRLAARGLPRRSTTDRCRCSPDLGGTARPVIIDHATPHRHDLRAGMEGGGGARTLLLLDSNVDGNAPEDRELTSRLYGGDAADAHSAGTAARRRRRARAACAGHHPGVLHLNEGPQRLRRARD